jgi:hypothetical protein
MPDNDAPSKAWPYWLLRHMLLDDEQSFWDLIWSVGGSPPYGGVSWKEAEAVYKLVESYRGRGTADRSYYAAVRNLIKGNRERERMLDLFECYDEIVSNSETYSLDLANKGLSIAKAMGDTAAIGLFTLLQAGVYTRNGELAKGAELSMDGLQSLLESAANDPAAGKRVAQAAQNVVSLTALSGNREKAASLLNDLSELIPADAVSQLRHSLSAR